MRHRDIRVLCLDVKTAHSGIASAIRDLVASDARVHIAHEYAGNNRDGSVYDRPTIWEWLRDGDRTGTGDIHPDNSAVEEFGLLVVRTLAEVAEHELVDFLSEDETCCDAIDNAVSRINEAVDDAVREVDNRLKEEGVTVVDCTKGSGAEVTDDRLRSDIELAVIRAVANDTDSLTYREVGY